MALKDISLANFTTVSFFDHDVGSGEFVEIAEVQSLTHPTDERTIIEVPEFGTDYPTKRVGSSSTGNAEVVVNFNPAEPSHIRMLEIFEKRALMLFRITINSDNAGTDSSFFEFNGQVASKTSSGEFDAMTTLTFSITVDGKLGEWDTPLSTPAPDPELPDENAP